MMSLLRPRWPHIIQDVWPKIAPTKLHEVAHMAQDGAKILGQKFAQAKEQAVGRVWAQNGTLVASTPGPMQWDCPTWPKMAPGPLSKTYNASTWTNTAQPASGRQPQDREFCSFSRPVAPKHSKKHDLAPAMLLKRLPSEQRNNMA